MSFSREESVDEPVRDPDAAPEPEESVPISGDEAGPTDSTAEAPMSELDVLQLELVEAREESAERLRGWQRAQADMENYKKLALQETTERVRAARAAVLLDLLQVVDDFERALAADHATDPEAWVEGVEMIERKFYQFLEHKDLSPIATEGQKFDPRFHEALGEAPGPSGQIVAQVQKGYLLADRVMRPARVIVGNGESGGEPTADSDSRPSDDSSADAAE
jgi:molecular chaperone GrpE